MLNHPNIIHIYDIDEADGELFIAMEYVAGQTLDRVIARQRLPLPEVLGYAVPMLLRRLRANDAPHPGEETHFHDAGLARVELRQGIQGFVKGDQFASAVGQSVDRFVQVQVRGGAPALAGAAGAGGVHTCTVSMAPGSPAFPGSPR